MTTALVWAISRGIDAIAQSENDGEQVPENLLEELQAATQQLDTLATRWRWAVGFGSSRKAADDDTAAERDALRQRVTELERAKAIPYRASTG